MKKFSILLALLLVTGCSQRIENPGPPQLTILEDAVIEVNQEGFNEDQLRSCFKAVDYKGKTLPDENVTFMTNVNISILGTSYINIKAVDDNGYYDIKTLKVTTVDHTAPAFRLPALTPVYLLNEQPAFEAKGMGIQLKDNFNREQTLISNARWKTIKPAMSVAGKLTMTLSTADSSGNTAEIDVEILVTQDPLEKAQYLFDKLANICQGSDDYFIFGANDGEHQRTEIINYDSLFDELFTPVGRQLMESSGFAERILNDNELVYWLWNSVQENGYDYIGSELSLKNQDDETMELSAETTWLHEGQTVTQTEPLVLKKENGIWKIDQFWYPFNGPDAAQNPEPSAVPSASPSAAPKN